MNKLLLIVILIIGVSCKDEVSISGLKDPVTTTPAVKPCDVGDLLPPSLQGVLAVDGNGTTNVSPTVSWNNGSDNCAIDHYDVAIGTTAGGEEVLSYTNVGKVNDFTQYRLVFDYTQDYFFSVRAVDTTGNISTTLISSPWKVFSPKALNNMVVWLDASVLSSIEDVEGDILGSNDFSGKVKMWKDLSGSNDEHHFVAGTSAPTWNAIVKGIQFDGNSQYMATANHGDINMSVSTARTITTVIKTSDDTQDRQVVYEEGGTVRGLNIYIEAGELHCGFWNIRNDGDGVQAYTEVSGAITDNSSYVVSYIFDYSNYVDANGVDGSVECVINGVSLGTVPVTSRLYAHPGAIGLGAINQHSYFPDGASSASHNFYFKGIIQEFMVHNTVHSDVINGQLLSTLSRKWLFP